jgi:membrane fusion protein YbhG
MKAINKIAILLILSATFLSCNKDIKADAYGNFEATEITVSAQAKGQLLSFKIDEGNLLKKQQTVGFIDTIPLYLKKQQLLAQNQIIYAKSKGVLSQIAVLKAQLKTAQQNLERTQKLAKTKSATQKQLDAVSGQVAVLKQQIKSIETQNIAVVNEVKNLNVQLRQVEDQIAKSFIINPVNGTVLTTYVEQSEIVTFGKPLYKIADLSTMKLRVYISESQLTNLKIGQKVTIKVDANKTMKSYKGIITWIASEAEFTPKIIQTKEERVNLVYAVKIDVKNDGSLKIGMPAEMWVNQ